MGSGHVSASGFHPPGQPPEYLQGLPLDLIVERAIETQSVDVLHQEVGKLPDIDYMQLRAGSASQVHSFPGGQFGLFGVVDGQQDPSWEDAHLKGLLDVLQALPCLCQVIISFGTNCSRRARPTLYTTPANRSQVRKGPGIASSLGRTTLAMLAKGEGLQAWATPTSPRMLRSTKASSILIPHSLASSRAASRHASRMASGYSTAVPWAIHASSVSLTGHSPCLSLSRSNRSVTSPAISTPVPQISPSPMLACMSPTANIPPLWRTGRSEEHTSELQSHSDLVCRLLLEKKKKKK